MDFVDSKIVFLTLGDLGSSRAVSSLLPIAINESALYGKFGQILPFSWQPRFIRDLIGQNCKNGKVGANDTQFQGF